MCTNKYTAKCRPSQSCVTWPYLGVAHQAGEVLLPRRDDLVDRRKALTVAVAFSVVVAAVSHALRLVQEKRACLSLRCCCLLEPVGNRRGQRGTCGCKIIIKSRRCEMWHGRFACARPFTRIK